MMVNRYDANRLLLVLQVDHSRVAGLLAAHWGNAEFTEVRPYASIVVAAQEHDSGWWDWEIKPTLNAQGYPIDYIGSIKNLGRGTWLGFYRHGIERLAQQDAYAAYIVSMHGDGLLTQGMGLLPYMPDYTSDPLVQDFIQQQKAYRSQLLEDLRAREDYREVTTDEHLWTNFKYMEVFDQFAQFICNRYPFNSTERKNGPSNTLSNVPVPVAPEREDTTITVDVRDEAHAIVHPWPFDVDRLDISFPARIIPDQPFASRQEFLRCFYTAEQVTINYSLQSA